MGHFRVISSGLCHPHYEFVVQFLRGSVEPGQAFSIYDTSHRFDFKVAEVQTIPEGVRLLCSADFLKHVDPKEKWATNMFEGKEVDTDDPTVAQKFSHYWPNKPKT